MRKLKIIPIVCLLLTIVFSFQISKAQNLEFNTDGLYNAELLDNIYRGHFENVRIDHEDLEFFQIYAKYLRVYGERCDKYLPVNKRMIMDDECVKERIEYNGYGTEINRYCIQWRKIESGIYARPELYAAQLELETFLGVNVLRDLTSMMNSNNAIGNSVDKIHKAKALLYDMSKILTLNHCDSPGLRRFEENLKAFAVNSSPIRMIGESKYVAMKKRGGRQGRKISPAS